LQAGVGPFDPAAHEVLRLAAPEAARRCDQFSGKTELTAGCRFDENVSLALPGSSATMERNVIAVTDDR
jgi:hypothetical protein